MPTSSRPRRRATRTNAVDPGKRGRPCPSSRPALTTPLPAGQASRFRAGTEVRRKRHSGSSPIPRSGIVPAPLPRPSDGGGCATRKARATRRRSSAPTPTWRRPRSSPPSCGAGRARSPSRNCAPISGAKHNARGHTRRSHDPPRPLRALQPRLPLGHRRALDKPPVLRRRLVPANPRHLLRGHRGHTMPTLAWKQFIALPATPGTKHNSARQDQADAVRPLLRSLMHKVELRG